jgi:hypothetical protein
MSYEPNYEPLSRITKTHVRRWCALYHAEFASSTLLAEACGDALRLHDDTADKVVPEDVYEIAAEFFAED